MKQYSPNEIKYIIDNFLSGGLTIKEWTHEAHLIVAIWCINTFGMEEACTKLKQKITRLNEIHGTPNDEYSGYHETITRFWLITASKFILDNDVFSITQACNLLIKSVVSKPEHILKFYDKEVLNSKEARKTWVTPNNQLKIKPPSAHGII